MQQKSLERPTAVILVGLPASGKTHYIQHVLLAQYPDAVVLSTDAYIERFAKKLHATYSEIFDRCMPAAIRLMMRAHRRAYAKKQNIIWDQTSLTVNSRRKKTNALRGYDLIAVVLDTADTLIEQRITQRPGKTIPAQVLRQMRASYVKPTFSEGYTQIIFTTTHVKENS